MCAAIIFLFSHLFTTQHETFEFKNTFIVIHTKKSRKGLLVRNEGNDDAFLLSSISAWTIKAIFPLVRIYYNLLVILLSLLNAIILSLFLRKKYMRRKMIFFLLLLCRTFSIIKLSLSFNLQILAELNMCVCVSHNINKMCILLLRAQ